MTSEDGFERFSAEWLGHKFTHGEWELRMGLKGLIQNDWDINSHMVSEKLFESFSTEWLGFKLTYGGWEVI